MFETQPYVRLGAMMWWKCLAQCKKGGKCFMKCSVMVSMIS